MIIISILITIYSILFAYISWRKPKWALLLICLALPSYLIRFNIWFIPFTLLELMILILFFVFFIKYLFQKPKLNLDYKWLIILFLIAATISLFVSPDLRTAAGIYKAYFLEPILFFFVFINLIKTKEDTELVLKSLGLSALAISVFAIYQKFTGAYIPNPFWQAEETRRVTSIFGYPNAVGLFLAPLITLYIGQIFKKPFDFRKNIFKILVVITSILAIIWAVSEGAIVAVIAGIFLVGILTKKTRWLTTATAIVVVLVVLFTPVIKEKVELKIFLKDRSGQIRLQMWDETSKMLKDRPLTGAGLAGYQKIIEPYHAEGIFIKNDDPNFLEKVWNDEEYRIKAWQPLEIYLYPHNIVLNFWSEMGLLGLISFILILIKFYWQGFKNFKNELTIPILGAMTTIIVHGMVDVPYFKNDLAILFWIIVGLMVINQKNNN